MSDLKESTISTAVVYKGDFLDVRRDEVLLPNGQTGTREWINHPGAVVIIPILPDGKIALIKQFRYAARSEFIELPAGKLDAGEKPEDCALRELEEEIGYKANKIKFLANIHPQLQLDVLKQCKNINSDSFVGLDTMDLWINNSTELSGLQICNQICRFF